MATKQMMLSTVDNPYNPFNEFDKWYAFDICHGYNCCGIVAANSYTSRELSDELQIIDINEAISRFVANDPLKLYTIVNES